MDKLKIPKLRFPSFNAEWEEKKIKNILNRVNSPVCVVANKKYKQIGIRSHGKGIFYKEEVAGSELGNKRVFWVEPNTFIVNIVFAWEQAIAKTTSNELGMIASHRFPMYRPQDKVLDLDFITIYFKTKRGKQRLELASPGGAGRNKTLGQKEFEGLKIKIPNILEQNKIANFLTTVDTKIQQFTSKKELLTKYKKGVMKKIFSQEIRFKDDEGNEFPEWEDKQLGDCLDYEQPTNYLVNSTEYDNSYTTPVVTAGKTFILGFTNETDGIFENYLPVIIFDDFTTATQYVTFPFKTKSSAMKILLPKKDINIKFVFEAMQLIQYELGGHGRHWISIFSFLTIQLPSYSEQQKIATFLTEIDNKIDNVTKKLEKVQLWKKELFKQMFL